jgi:hypothetical protein
MFCPSCGIEEKQFNQFCRACGTDLRPARKVLEMPDIITASAETAREEIGRAFAIKIRDAETAVDLKIVAEDVLPQIEKFLESPAEKRLRRIRTGVITSSVGIGVTILLFFLGLNDQSGLFMGAVGLIPFFVGLGLILNGLHFTVPQKELPDKSSDAQNQRELDAQTNELVLPESSQVFSSVTEHTTQHLKEKQPISRS